MSSAKFCPTTQITTIFLISHCSHELLRNFALHPLASAKFVQKAQIRKFDNPSGERDLIM